MDDGPNPKTFLHRHQPLYRVIREGWDDPLDASFSRRVPDRRWNTADFPALYCCCSEAVARAVALDVFRQAGVDPEDLQPAFRPQLAEIGWSGEVVDVVSPEGVEEAGFPAAYPAGVDRSVARAAAERWHAAGAEGICSRSASQHRLGRTSWQGDHESYGEVAVFPENAREEPRLLGRRRGLDWLRPGPVR